MTLIALYGHQTLHAGLRAAVAHGKLPASLLIQGPTGVGKQRLALALARALVCDGMANGEPCEKCQSCRFSRELTHPDLRWFFPIERPKDPDQTPSEVLDAYAELIAERVDENLLYERPSGEHGLYVSTVRAIVHIAALSPALSRRKVFVIGDAERMVSQEGSDQAANAFLKLLEEPLPDTTIILTSSEPGALLPTVRSRVIVARAAPLPERDVRAFVSDPLVIEHLGKAADKQDELVTLAAGAPGRILDRVSVQGALDDAHRLLEAASSPDAAPRFKAALTQGGRGARGRFTDTLDALTVLLHEKARAATKAGLGDQALRITRAVDAVERAKEMTLRNVNPQLITASLLRQISVAVR